MQNSDLNILALYILYTFSEYVSGSKLQFSKKKSFGYSVPSKFLNDLSLTSVYMTTAPWNDIFVLHMHPDDYTIFLRKVEFTITVFPWLVSGDIN